jgi:hypothetical protein
MSRSILITLLCVAAAAMLPAGAHARRGGPPFDLPPPQLGKKCSLASIKGSYGYSYTGTVEGFGGIAAVGPIDFDGTGNTSATYSVNLGGVSFQGSFTGTYTVADDCTGTIIIDLPLLHLSSNGRFVVVENGREAFFMGVDPGVTVTGVAKKQ